MTNKNSLKKKIGVISPIGEIPPELITLYGHDFDYVAANANVKSLTNEGYSNAIKNFPLLMNELLKENIKGITVMGTSLTFYRGREFNEKIEKDLQRQTGLPVITMTTAIIQALNQVRAKNIAIATAYSNEITNSLIKTLSEYEKNVCSVFNINYPMSDIPNVSSKEIVDLGLRAVNNKAVDGLLISCGGLRTLEATKELEKVLNIPVISSAVAGAWATARLLGCNKSIKDAGVLLE